MVCPYCKIMNRNFVIERQRKMVPDKNGEKHEVILKKRECINCHMQFFTKETEAGEQEWR